MQCHRCPQLTEVDKWGQKCHSETIHVQALDAHCVLFSELRLRVLRYRRMRKHRMNLVTVFPPVGEDFRRLGFSPHPPTPGGEGAPTDVDAKDGGRREGTLIKEPHVV
jgi:hypothetical protein